jgi:OFA family oxalate/formate antiporter-like MFS transporter
LNYGVLFTAWGAAGVFGPMIGGRVFDSFGDYRYAFYAASALAIVAFGSLAMVREKRLGSVAISRFGDLKSPDRQIT